GELAFGTVDSFLLWRFTEGAVHATDATNAARTLLYDLHRGVWDDELLALFRVPRAVLPEIRDNIADFGGCAGAHFGAPIAVTGMAGDQQAAAIGQACLTPGMIKSTYGTGCFALLNTGATPLASRHRLLTTLAYRIDGVASYALEGSIFVAGAAIQWLKEGLGILAHAKDAEALARAADPGQRVFFVPAFTGLGAPYWDAEARGAIFGLTRDTGRPEFVRAALEAASFQTLDLIEAMRADGAAPSSLRVDGGMVVNDWFAQSLADIVGLAVERPAVTETTILGAAILAGRGSGIYPKLTDVAARWRRERLFEPRLSEDERMGRHEQWRAAVARTLGQHPLPLRGRG
ncbi:MAG TPA: FGGY-family carbohydrate kinase, partial [Stellaceae bacterium]|nr:FGGY-family carbohydrate kinase [Stellaceae bacterium]